MRQGLLFGVLGIVNLKADPESDGNRPGTQRAGVVADTGLGYLCTNSGTG